MHSLPTLKDTILLYNLTAVLWNQPRVFRGRNDIQHNGMKYNDTQHNDTEHNGRVLLSWVW